MAIYANKYTANYGIHAFTIAAIKPIEDNCPKGLSNSKVNASLTGNHGAGAREIKVFPK